MPTICVNGIAPRSYVDLTTHGRRQTATDRPPRLLTRRRQLDCFHSSARIENLGRLHSATANAAQQSRAGRQLLDTLLDRRSDQRSPHRLGQSLQRDLHGPRRQTVGGERAQVPITLSTQEFTERWSQHIQPDQLTKVRYFGGWSNHSVAAYRQRCHDLCSTTARRAPDRSGKPKIDLIWSAKVAAVTGWC